MNTPAFESLPSAVDIAHWYVEEKKDEPNVGGDAWWLSRDPHSSCRRLAEIDMDTQHWVLLDVATGDTKDLLLVSHGLDGLWCDWYMHPVSDRSDDPYWERNGIAWLADQIIVDSESRSSRPSKVRGETEPRPLPTRRGTSWTTAAKWRPPTTTGSPITSTSGSTT